MLKVCVNMGMLTVWYNTAYQLPSNSNQLTDLYHEQWDTQNLCC